MLLAVKKETYVLRADKNALRAILGAQEAREGFVPDGDATVEGLHRRMLAEGVRPEESIPSGEILRMREE